jgi:hypothetical protein
MVGVVALATVAASGPAAGLSDRLLSDADPVRLQINRERTLAVNRMFLVRTLERESLVRVLLFILLLLVGRTSFLR